MVALVSRWRGTVLVLDVAIALLLTDPAVAGVMAISLRAFPWSDMVLFMLAMSLLSHF
jgi:hypothetical protein